MEQSKEETKIETIEYNVKINVFLLLRLIQILI